MEYGFSDKKKNNRKKDKYIVFIVAVQGSDLQHPYISGFSQLHVFFFFFYFRHVMEADIIHTRYHVSLTVPGIATLISNILIAARSYILLSLCKKG